MRVCLFGVFWAVLAVSGSAAGEATNRGLSMRLVQGGTPYIEARMPEFLTSELIGLVRTGVAVSVRYDVLAYGRGMFGRTPWPVAVFGYDKRLEYSPEANVYVLSRPGLTVRLGSLEAALARFREPDRIALPESVRRSLGEHRLRGRMRMETLRLYPPLSFFVGLLDVYNFTTRWVDVE